MNPTVAIINSWVDDPSCVNSGADYREPTLEVDRVTVPPGYVDIVVHEHDPSHGNWGADAVASLRLTVVQAAQLAQALNPYQAAGGNSAQWLTDKVINIQLTPHYRRVLLQFLDDPKKYQHAELYGALSALAHLADCVFGVGGANLFSGEAACIMEMADDDVVASYSLSERRLFAWLYTVIHELTT